MIGFVMGSLFVLALGIAVAVIVAEIAPQIARIQGLLDGSLHEVVSPLPIAMRNRRRRAINRPRLSPAIAAARAAA